MAKAKSDKVLRSLPQVDKLLRHPSIKAREAVMRRECLANLTRSVLDEYRNLELLQPVDEDELAAVINARADQLLQGSLQKVINGSGVILNTNLGRAPLPLALVEKLTRLLPGYSSLEIDLESGTRGERAKAIERLLTVLTGCEAAMVVNNCAAAVLLLVSALAHGREVIVSRGELIEIGGSFRLPDVIVASGAILKEVGTTNRTGAGDYARAVNEKTALLMKCHRSNFEITGFTEEAKLEELRALSQARGIPLVLDLGSGAMLDLSDLGVKHEPTVQEALKDFDVVMFSADKLLGGSQAGLIVGKKHLIKELRSHPTYRAVRLDKLNIALLEATLAEYLKPDAALRLPVYQMASLPAYLIEERAQAMTVRVNAALHHLRCDVVETKSAFGGGTMPSETMKSFGLKIGIADGAEVRISSSKLATLFRQYRPAILPMTSADHVIIDLRTVARDEDSEIERALVDIDSSLAAQRR